MSAQTTSARRRAASRANGAKSRGPVTAAGKARSAQNAATHGFTSSCRLADLAHTLCLAHEDTAAFEATYHDLAVTYRPANPAEVLILQEMATARWRLQRLWLTETHLQAKQMCTVAPRARETQGSRLTAGLLVALGFEDLVDNSHALALLIRYEARLSRQFQRGLAQLQASRVLTAQDTADQNEPSPINEHQESTHDDRSSSSPVAETSEPAPASGPVTAPVCADAAQPGEGLVQDISREPAGREFGGGAAHPAASAVRHADYLDRPASDLPEPAFESGVPPATGRL